jgi:pilus assembly protein CpaB
MDAKKLVLLIGALVVAAVSAVLARSMFSGAATPVAAATQPAVAVGPEVLVATKALPVGTIIDAESLRYQPWPKDLIQDAYYLKDGGPAAAQLVGTVVRNEITAGQPVTQGALVKPGDRGFLAAALGPGMRAVTVPVSSQSAVAGFVFPGDRVDLIMSQTVDGGGGPALKTSETIVRNLRVLATDQRTSQTDAEGKTNVTTYSSVTVEATPRIAEKIAVAQSIGQLTLSLRSIADNTAELERAIASGEVNVPAGSDPAAERKMMLAIASRPADTGTTFVTGADVSRFQRRSAPAPTAPAPAPVAAAPAVPAGAAPAAPAAPAGPAVRVARGNTVTVVPVGGK